jgi:exopolysaccharide/PEP-CTERM locus tyrosine autokinase
MNGGKMSKIYKALEKAEKERGEELKEETSFVSEEEEEKRREGKKIMPPLLESGGTISDQSLIYFSQPASLAAEQFRKLRTYLLKHKSSDFPKTIMVTSATSGEGKSFVSANLAIGIARDLHYHALLVDCDLRNPTLAHLFGLENAKGLSDYLTGDRNISEFLMKTKIEKLTILPGGKVQDNPTELIGSKKMEALVHELKSQYRDRYVIFDSTPLLATAESEVLAKMVDDILIVVRAGITPRETVIQAIASLEKKKIFGLVLNDVEFKSSGLSSRYFGSDGYSYRYGYGYGYGKRGGKPQSRWGKIFPFKKKLS